MKSFSFLVFLNVLVLFTYAQDQAKPITCEERFSLKGTTCTPCQQAISKHDSLLSTLTKQPTSNKCLVVNIFVSNILEIGLSNPDTSGSTDASDTKKNTIEALDKTCAETANNACSESDTKSVYTEIDKACDAELKQYLSSNETDEQLSLSDFTNNVGLQAKIMISNYYLAPSTREIMCLKVDGEYCTVKLSETLNQTQSQSPITNPIDNIQCDECSKQNHNIQKSYILSHPPDTPNLQKIFANYSTESQEIEKKCPNFVSGGSGIKSDGQTLTNQFYNYSGIILISLVGFIYTNFI